MLFRSGLGDLDPIGLPPPPADDGDFYDVYQNYEIEAERRDALREHLAAHGIETMVPWGGRGLHMFRHLGLQHVTLPRTDLLFRRVLLLPMFPELTDAAVADVIAAVKAATN